MAWRVALLLTVVLACLAIGWWRRRSDGRIHATAAPAAADLAGADLGALGARATLVQFSAEFCAPCRAATRVLAAAATDGVVHTELDVAQHPELVRRLDVHRTPTVLVLDPAGRETHRLVGVPRPAELAHLLRDLPLGRNGDHD